MLAALRSKAFEKARWLHTAQSNGSRRLIANPGPNIYTHIFPSLSRLDNCCVADCICGFGVCAKRKSSWSCAMRHGAVEQEED